MNGLAVKQQTYEVEEESQPDFLIIGIDISETEADNLRLPIRIGFNGEKYIWIDDIDPQ